jgi:hypothetical protein
MEHLPVLPEEDREDLWFSFLFWHYMEHLPVLPEKDREDLWFSFFNLAQYGTPTSAI